MSWLRHRRAFSSFGIVIRFSNPHPSNAYDEALGTVTDFDLTLYDREEGMVAGYDNSVDIEIYDDE
jgi:hypothetical protein